MECPNCKGLGVVTITDGQRYLPWWISPLGWLLSKRDTEVCKACNGTGKVEG